MSNKNMHQIMESFQQMTQMETQEVYKPYDAKEDAKLQKIVHRYPHEVQNLLKTGDFDNDLYSALYDYYTSGDSPKTMPYGTQTARDGDPYEWIYQEFTDAMDSIGANPYQAYNPAGSLAEAMDLVTNEGKGLSSNEMSVILKLMEEWLDYEGATGWHEVMDNDIEHALTTGSPEGKQILAKINNLPHAQYSNVIHQIKQACADYGDSMMNEAWDEKTETPKSKQGMFDGKTKEELLKQYRKLKASGPHEKGSDAYTKMKQLGFAIRAKSGWGKVAEEQADKDYDGDGKIESDKDEVWGSRMKAAAKAGNLEEGISSIVDFFANKYKNFSREEVFQGLQKAKQELGDIDTDAATNMVLSMILGKGPQNSPAFAEDMDQAKQQKMDDIKAAVKSFKPAPARPVDECGEEEVSIEVQPETEPMSQERNPLDAIVALANIKPVSVVARPIEMEQAGVITQKDYEDGMAEGIDDDDKYWDFKDLPQMMPNATRKVAGRAYGGSAQPYEPFDMGDEDEAPVKRGRGRPAGVKTKLGSQGPRGNSKLMSKAAIRESEDAVDVYDEYLDETYPVVKMEGTVLYPSTILRLCDPVAYRIGSNDYLEAELGDDFGGDDELAENFGPLGAPQGRSKLAARVQDMYMDGMDAEEIGQALRIEDTGMIQDIIDDINGDLQESAVIKVLRHASFLTEGKVKAAKPDFLDIDKDGNKKEPMKKAVKQVDEGADEGIDMVKLAKVIASCTTPEQLEVAKKMAKNFLGKHRAPGDDFRVSAFKNDMDRERSVKRDINAKAATLSEKSKSQAQARMMAGAAHDKDFAKKVGVKQSVAKEFNKADKGTKISKLPKHVDEESTEKRDNRAEKAGKRVTKDLEYDMKHKGKDDKKAERAGKKVTKDIEYDEKKKKVKETTCAGSVAPAAAADNSAANSKYGFGQGIYESMDFEKAFNKEVKQLNEGLSININVDNSGQKSINVSATDEDADHLAEILKMAGMGGMAGAQGVSEAQVCETCGAQQCECAMMEADELANGADDTEVANTDTLVNQFSGGLNGRQKQINPNNRGDNPMSMKGLDNKAVDLSLDLSESANSLIALINKMKK